MLKHRHLELPLAQSCFTSRLSESLKERLLPFLTSVTLPLGKELYEAGELHRHIYFPVDAIVSLMIELESGDSTEIAIVGNDGLVGIALFLGGDCTSHKAVVQSAGKAYRIDKAQIQPEFEIHGEFMRCVLLYTQSLMTQMAQTAFCNRHHSIHQQLCRWLLLSHDRIPGDELIMTQELIANMLGVRREGVTQAAGHLQDLSVIDYRRGHITILDRAQLERLSCECYAIVKSEIKRLEGFC